MADATVGGGNAEREGPFSEAEYRGPPRRNNSYTSVPTEDTIIPPTCPSSSDEIPENGDNNENTKAFTTVLDWSLELLALFVAFLSFGAVVAILSAYHDEVQPSFTYNISINTLVAIFSTILRATLLFVVSEVIGQSKWRWMTESPRPLRHIQRFDDAGKGVWGSLKIIFMRKPTLTMVGAFVVVTSYAIGPFSQQATTTYSCERTTGNAKIMIVKTADIDFRMIYHIPPGMAAAAITGLIFGAENAAVPASNLFQCDSGNCTFSAPFGITHSSVGICNKCIDTGDSIEAFDQGENGTNYGFRDNANLSITWPKRPEKKFKDGYVSKNFNVLSQFPNYTLSVLAFSAATCANDAVVDDWPAGFRQCNQKYGVISATDGTLPGRDAGIVGVNCTLFPCVYHYNANVVNGVLKEDVVSYDPMIEVRAIKGSLFQKATRYTSHKIGMIEPCNIRGVWYDSSNIDEASRDDDWTTWRITGGDLEFDLPSSCTRVAVGIDSALRSLIVNTVVGVCNYTWSNIYPEAIYRAGVPVRPNEVVGKGMCDHWLLDALYETGNATQGSIKTAFDNLATAMTNYMRTNTWNTSELRFRNEPPASVAGSSTQTLICIRVEWQWLIYPGILLVLTAVLLAEACIRSHRDRARQPVWKSAILPFLFYDITTRGSRPAPDDRDGAREAVPLLSLRDLELLADKTVTRFDRDKRAPGFIVEDGGREIEKGRTGSV